MIKRVVAWLMALVSSVMFSVLMFGFITRPKHRPGFGITQGYMQPVEATGWVLAGIVVGAVICFFVFVRKLYAKEPVDG